jgi:CRP/FNR family transcriptional regulator
MQTDSVMSLADRDSPYRVQPVSGTAEELAGIEALRAALGPERRLARNEHLFYSADRCAELYFVGAGALKVQRLAPGGEEQIVSFHFAGDILGFEAFGAPSRGCSAVALEATRVRALPLAALQSLCGRSMRQQRWFLRLLSRRLAELQEHMLTLGRKSAYERLAGFLVELAARSRQTELRLSMSRYAIGCYLGLALETVSRLLRQLQDEGLIRVHGRRIRLVEAERLEHLARGLDR